MKNVLQDIFIVAVGTHQNLEADLNKPENRVGLYQ